MLDSWHDMAAALPSLTTPEQRMRKLREFYATQTGQLVLQSALGLHDFTELDDSNAPLIEHTIVIGIDTESWTKNTDEMTEIGLAVFERKDMMEVQAKKREREEDNSATKKEYEHLGDFGEELLKQITFHHLRIVETAHLRTNASWMKGPEGNRFGQSRFVTFAEARDVLHSLFVQPIISNNPELMGCHRPVVLVGHAMKHDHINLKKKHGLQYDWKELETIVMEIDTQPLAKATKTWNNPEAPTNEVGLERLTRTLGFEHSDAHTACNDASRTLISAIQMVLPKECREDKARDMQTVALEIEKHSLDNDSPTWGSEFCCTRCGGRDHKDEDSRRCEVSVHCKACAKHDPDDMDDHWKTHIDMYCIHVADYKAYLRRKNNAIRKRKVLAYDPPEGSHPPSDVSSISHMMIASPTYQAPQTWNGGIFIPSGVSGAFKPTYNASNPTQPVSFRSPVYRRGGSKFPHGNGVTRSGNGWHEGNRFATDE